MRKQSGVYQVTEERRAEARVPVNARVKILYGDRSHSAWLRDISSTGALVLRGAAPRPARLHRIEIEAAGRPMQLLARTVRSVGTFHAVRFVGLDAMDRLELAELVDRLRQSAA
ncbi:MAG: PilZ domain-containing protein [Myxococcales bacterium]|nr:PilZ domain-containing protein [Myxococcales bacterium]